MGVADPIAWKAIEQALFTWVVASTDIPATRVRTQRTRDQGEARGPAPKATITMVGAPVPLQLQGRSTQERVMQQRYTVIANGPGEVGIDFYPGFSATAQRISITAGIGDLPAVSAAALLAELIAELPAGYTASADPMDTASALVDGSEAEPLFAAASADLALLTVADVIPRHVVILKIEHNITWRVSFRSDAVSGATTAANSMAKCMMMRKSYLDPAMRALSYRASGTPLATSDVAPDRRESTAFLDVMFRGFMTGAQASTTLRLASVNQTVAA